MKKYVKPTLTKVLLNPAQAVLSICSTFPAPTLSGAGGATCKTGGAPSTRCKKTGVGGDNAGRC